VAPLCARNGTITVDRMQLDCPGTADLLLESLNVLLVSTFYHTLQFVAYRPSFVVADHSIWAAFHCAFGLFFAPIVCRPSVFTLRILSDVISLTFVAY
jgi:hypothetical protein